MYSLRTLAIAYAAASLLGVPASRAAAQKVSKVPTGAMSGIVKDSLGHAVPNVEVTAVRAAKSVRTDTAGHFLITDIPSGAVEVSVRRLAYSPAMLTIDIPAEDTTDVEITLSVVAQRLSAVVVQAAGQLRELVDFENRRKQGIGHFITRAQIESGHPLLLSDMVRRIPGTLLIPADNGRTALRFSRVSRNNCPPQFYIDGMEVYGFSIDDMPPGDVEGVELYAGAAGLPPEFNRVHSTSICGTVVIWTRIPGNNAEKKKQP